MAQQVMTRTIHTITIDVQDDVLSRIEAGDEIEIMLMPRSGNHDMKMPRPIKLSYQWTRWLLPS